MFIVVFALPIRATCKLRNCPVGDTTTQRHNFGGLIEIQRVFCTLTPSRYFYLSFRGQVTNKIYATDHASDIKYKLEELLTVGNVSVRFPGTEVLGKIDTVGTACSTLFNSTFGKDFYFIDIDDVCLNKIIIINEKNNMYCRRIYSFFRK